MNFRLIIGLAILFICSCGRKKVPNELVLNEYIIEKNGVYYAGDCEIHADKRYTGTDTFYHNNGKIKGTFTIINGIPEGHWQRFNEQGTKQSDLFFNKGVLSKYNH